MSQAQVHKVLKKLQKQRVKKTAQKSLVKQGFLHRSHFWPMRIPPPNARARFWASNAAKLRAANGVSRSKLPVQEDLHLCLASFALSPQVGTIVRAQRGKEPTKKPRLLAWFSVGLTGQNYNLIEYLFVKSPLMISYISTKTASSGGITVSVPSTLHLCSVSLGFTRMRTRLPSFPSHADESTAGRLTVFCSFLTR